MSFLIRLYNVHVHKFISLIKTLIGKRHYFLDIKLFY
jgi:hypothetical protein